MKEEDKKVQTGYKNEKNGVKSISKLLNENFPEVTWKPGIITLR